MFDSYAEALMMNGDLEASVKNYEKAVEVALQNEGQDVELFKENLATAKKRLENKK